MVPVQILLHVIQLMPWPGLMLLQQCIGPERRASNHRLKRRSQTSAGPQRRSWRLSIALHSCLCVVPNLRDVCVGATYFRSPPVRML